MAYVSIALQHLSSNVRPDIRIQIKPSRVVYAESDIAKGKLVLLPETKSIKVLKPKEEVPPASYKVQVPTTLTSRTVVLNPSFSESFASPVWLIKGVNKAEDANMVVEMKKVNISVGPAQGKGAKGHANSTIVSIPVLVNKTGLKKDDVLTIYRETKKVEPVAKRLISVNLTSNKSARTS